MASNAAPGENLRINGDRLWDSIHALAEIGPGVAGGSNRQTVTDEDAEGRALFQKWCEEAGLTMGLDTMGTMFMTRAGTDPDALPVYVGSHLDTQPTGGRYDGVLGVLAGLEVVRTLNDLDIKTKHPIVVTNWTNEEGTRYAPAMMASGVFAGIIPQEEAYAKTDANGLTFGDELERIGWKGDEPGRRTPDARLSRTPHRAGADTGGRGRRYRRRHPRAGPALDRMHGDGQGKPHRLHPHADAQERRSRLGADHRAGSHHRHGQRPQRRGRHRPYRRPPQQSQHHPRQGGVHHRLSRLTRSTRCCRWSLGSKRKPPVCARRWA